MEDHKPEGDRGRKFWGERCLGCQPVSFPHTSNSLQREIGSQAKCLSNNTRMMFP